MKQLMFFYNGRCFFTIRDLIVMLHKLQKYGITAA